MITLDTLEQPSIPLSPSECIRNYKLDEFPFVMHQHGGCCIEVGGLLSYSLFSRFNVSIIYPKIHVLYHQAANENMNEMLLEAVARREIGTKEADGLRDDSSSASFKRDKVPLYHFRATA